MLGMGEGLKTPVVLIIFNRPNLTRAVFERIRSVKPHTLMIVADGPRNGRATDSKAVRLTRQIVENVDWPCELLKNYSDANMGCGVRVASGIDWVFQHVEEAIILEDDCLPDPSFFPFCGELLERYRDHERVMQISGSNFLFDRYAVEQSYYFSRYPVCWGWATWRRAWRRNDFEMSAWKTDPERCLARFADKRERDFWQTNLEAVRDGRVDTWDYQWSLACQNANGLAVTPSENLVTNVGFGPDATHTTSRLLSVRPAVRAIKFPLRHPRHLEPNIEADEFTARRIFYKRSRLGKAAELLRRRLFAALSHAGRGYESPEVSSVTMSSVRSK